VAAEKALKRRQKESEEEVEVAIEEFFKLPERRKYFQDKMGEYCKLATKFLIDGAPEKSPGLSYFAYFFANFPSTRHENK
jgi:hypothetical protein